jgi:pimeloyl-ACP methyl ester carboxylesterase
VLDAIGARRDLILVAQSMGGFTAPMVAARLPVELLVLVAAMVPNPGETPGDWWDNTGYVEARRVAEQRAGRPVDAPFEALVTFFHDVPADVTAAAMARRETPQSGTPFGSPCEFEEWPARTRFLLCRDDRFFPAELQRRVVRERLGFEPDEMQGGHLPALARPAELVERLEAYRTGA